MNSNHQTPAGDEPRRARWTAFALDQLEAAECRTVEAEVAESEDARQYVAEVRALAGQVRALARQEAGAVEPSPALREALEERLSHKEVAAMETKSQTRADADASPATRTRWTRRRWIALAAAASLLVAAVPTYFAMSAAQRNSRNVAKNELAANAESARSRVMPTADAPRDRAEVIDEGRRKDRRDSEVRPHIETAEAAAARAVQDLADGQNKFNEDRKDFAAMEQRKQGQPRFQATPVPESKPVSGPSASPMDGQFAAPSGSTHDVKFGNVQSGTQGIAGAYDYALGQMGPGGQSKPGGQPGALPQPAERLELAQKKLQDDAATLMAPAPGTEQYDRIVENPFVPVAEQPQSTFSIDVDTASYANVRRFLTHGTWPPADAVRIEEMVNYFHYDYPLPRGDAPFSVDMEVAQCPWAPDHRLLRVGLKGEEIDRKQRGLSNLVFLLDVSGSMSSQDKLTLVKQAMRLLVGQLDENDRVAIVTYAGTTGVHLESTNGEKRERIISSIESLSAGGSTNGGAGIQLAYEQAVRYFIKEGTNRVILCTDGDLNVGITRDDDLVRLIKDRAKSGVFLTVLGFGTGNLKDSKLEKLADHGNGLYAYVDSLREAQKVLVEQLTGSLITIAKDVKLQIEFNPAEVASYRLIGYENRVMAARDFHDDKKDAGEIGAGHTVTALYELVPVRANTTDAAAQDKARGDTAGKLKYQQGPAVHLTKAAGSGELLTLSLRYKKPDAERSKLLEFTAKDSAKRIGESSKDFQFASAVAAFGMILRHSKHCGQATLSAVEEIAASAVGNDPGGYRAEFVDLVRRAKQLRR